MLEKSNEVWVVTIDCAYYSENHPYQSVTKDKATKMTRKRARLIASYLRQPKIGYKTDIEEYNVVAEREM